MRTAADSGSSRSNSPPPIGNGNSGGLRILSDQLDFGGVADIAVFVGQHMQMHADQARTQQGAPRRSPSATAARPTPYLQNLLEGEILPLPVDEDARLNNVFGYWKYGQHIWLTA